MLKLQAVSMLLAGARMKPIERIALERNLGAKSIQPGKKLREWQASIPAGRMYSQFVKNLVAETQLVETLILESGGLSARAVQLKLKVPTSQIDVLAVWVQGWNSRIIFDQKERAFRVLAAQSHEHIERIRELNAQADQWEKFVDDLWESRKTRAVKVLGRPLRAEHRRSFEALVYESMADLGIF